MIDFLYYLLKVSGIFSILYLVYPACFSRLTFHNLNRAYLMATVPLSLILPVLRIELGQNSPIAKKLPLLFSDFGGVEKMGIQAGFTEQFELTTGNLFFVVYSLVLLIWLTKLILDIFHLFKIRRRARTQTSGKFSVIHAGISSAFSFFNWVFLPQDIDSETSGQIIEHEKLHGKSFHTIDLIVTELFVAFFWFNPLVYLFRRDLKSVHEFQIDRLLLKGNLKTSDYLQLLLRNIERSGAKATFCNNFNGSTIGRRVKMMTKSKSSSWKTARYFLLIPLIASLTMAFSNNSGTGNNIPDISPIKAGASFAVSSGYGNRIHPVTKEKNFHYGIDFKAQTGTPVVATADGVVTRIVFREGSYGKLIEIDHGNGYSTRYAQLDGYAVKEGDKVKRGNTIGYVGHSGLSTGSHLHYEVFKKGKNVNPRNYIRK